MREGESNEAVEEENGRRKRTREVIPVEEE